MACAGSQVKDTVMANLVPHETFSTRWRFSVPEEKKETRPEEETDGHFRREERRCTRKYAEKDGLNIYKYSGCGARTGGRRNK